MTPFFAFAKKSENKMTNPRLMNLNSEEQEMFNSLSKSQQKRLLKGKIEDGDNAWMVKKALGEPFYVSEHHPQFTDYEEVWLYTKSTPQKQVRESKIIDPQTHWPSVHRVTTTKQCMVGDFFVLFDRGVVKKKQPDTSEKVYGSCTIETIEEFLPIVDKKKSKR